MTWQPCLQPLSRDITQIKFELFYRTIHVLHSTQQMKEFERRRVESEIIAYFQMDDLPQSSTSREGKESNIVVNESLLTDQQPSKFGHWPRAFSLFMEAEKITEKPTRIMARTSSKVIMIVELILKQFDTTTDRTDMVK